MDRSGQIVMVGRYNGRDGLGIKDGLNVGYCIVDLGCCDGNVHIHHCFIPRL